MLSYFHISFWFFIGTLVWLHFYSYLFWPWMSRRLKSERVAEHEHPGRLLVTSWWLQLPTTLKTSTAWGLNFGHCTLLTCCWQQDWSLLQVRSLCLPITDHHRGDCLDDTLYNILSCCHDPHSPSCTWDCSIPLKACVLLNLAAVAASQVVVTLSIVHTLSHQLQWTKVMLVYLYVIS